MKKNKKIIVGIVALVAVIAVFIGLYAAFGPKAQAGTKKISIEVVNEVAEKKTYAVKTDAEFLKQAMDETKGLVYEASDKGFGGMFVDSINGKLAEGNAYWAIYVNGEYGNYGIEQQPVADGDVYLFEYTVYVPE